MPLQIPYSGEFRRESKAGRLFVAADSAVFLLILHDPRRLSKKIQRREAVEKLKIQGTAAAIHNANEPIACAKTDGCEREDT